MQHILMRKYIYYCLSALQKLPLPYKPIVMNSFSKWYGRSSVVTGAFIRRHTFATFIHVGSIYAGAAINWDKLDVACDIRLTQRATSGLTGINVITVT